MPEASIPPEEEPRNVPRWVRCARRVRLLFEPSETDETTEQIPRPQSRWRKEPPSPSPTPPAPTDGDGV